MAENELFQDSIRYVPSKAAAKRAGLSPDYISRFCREGLVIGIRHRGTWYVNEASLDTYLAEHAREREEYNRKLSEQAREEAEQASAATPLVTVAPHRELQAHVGALARTRASKAALAQTLAILVILVSAVSTFALTDFASDARTSLAHNFGSARTAAQSQLAAASSLPWFDAIGDTFFRIVCPIFNACTRSELAENAAPAPRAPQPVPAVQPQRAPTPPISSPAREQPAQQPIQQIINQPIIERITETVRVESGLTSSAIDARFAALEKTISQRLASASPSINFSGPAPSTPVSVQTFAVAQKIDNLSGVAIEGGTIRNATITGGSIDGGTITGTITGAIDSLLGTIADLTSTTLVATNATTTNLAVTGSATIGSATGVVQTTSGVVSTIPNGGNGQVLKIVGGTPTWSADLQGSGGASAWATTSNDLAVYPSDPDDVVIIGDDATSTSGNILEVAGASLFRGALTAYNVATAPRFTATSTTASQFPYASTTAISATTASSSNLIASNSFTFSNVTGFLKATAGAVATAAIDLANDVTGILGVARGGTGWSNIASGAVVLGNGTGALATTSAGTNGQVLALANGIPTWVATTTFSAPLVFSNGNVTLSTSGDWTGTFDGQEGSYYLNANNLTNFGTPFFNFFSATTTDALAQGATNRYYADSLVQGFIHSSSTIPKTYTANAFTALQSFQNASSSFVSSGYASSTLWFGGGLASTCAGGNFLTWTAGQFGCAGDQAGATFGKTFELVNGALAPTTTVGLIISASSTFSGGASFDRSTTTNATSTSFFAALGRFTNTVVDTLLTAVSATITNLTTTTLTATNATTTRLDAFDYVAVGRTATTTLRGDNVASTIPFASSTAITVSGTASTSALVVSNLNAVNCDVKSSPAGVLSCGTDATGGASFGEAWEIGGNGFAGFLAPTTTLRLWLGQASSTLLSAHGAFFGATATSSFNSAGVLTLAGNPNGPLDARNGVVGATTSVGVLYGGTGATSAAGARTNLAAAASGANADITSLSALTHATTSFLFVNSALFNSASIGGTATSTFASNGSISVGNALTVPGQTSLAQASSTMLSALRGYFGATATSSFDGNGALTLSGTPNGPLHANNGLVAATTSIGVLYGGTGLTSISNNQLIIGNSSGGFTAIATSTLFSNSGQLALWLSDETGTGAFVLANTPTLASPTFTGLSSFTLASSTQQSILDGLFVGRTATTTIRGDGVASIIPYASTTALTVSGTGYLGLLAATQTSGTSTIASGQGFTIGGSQFLLQQGSGNVGIGTSSPWANLSVNAGAGQNSFAIGSSTGTYFLVNSLGNIGIATTSPGYKLDVNGTIAGNLLDRGGQVFNVKAFGARCDASTDDTAAIQAAENARETAGGGTLFFPTGVCKISGTITVNMGGLIAGSGHGLSGAVAMATVLRTTSTTADTFLITTMDGITVRDLQIDATGVTKTSGAGIKIQPTTSPYGANINRQSHIENVTILNMVDAVALYNTANFSITDSFIQDFRNVGIYINQNSTVVDAGDAIISGNTIWDFNVTTGAAGIRLDPAAGIEIIGNKILGADKGIWLTVSQGPTGTVNVVGNSFEEHNVSCFYAEQSTAGKTYGNITFNSNECSMLATGGVAQSGVTLAAGAAQYLTNVVISANVFNMGLTTGGRSIISISDGDGVVVSNNVLNNLGNSGATGIATGGNATNVTILGNTYLGIPSGKYGSLNSNTTVFDVQSSGLSYLSGKFGIASSTPWGQLSITNTGTNPSFIVEDSASPDTSPFIIDASGNVGIGTTNPQSILDIPSGTSGTDLVFTRAGTVKAYVGTAITFGTAATDDLALRSEGSNILFGFSGTETMRLTSSGNAGIASTTPWRKLSVTGTVGFDGLTGSTGAGSLCLDTNKQVVYNSGSDACLSSTRATKHDINPLVMDALEQVLALQPVSFIYNDGDGRTRYGFIAEDAAEVDARLATYNASGTISGIDDRAVLSVVVKAIKEFAAKLNDLATTVANFAQSFTSKEIHATNLLCIGETCMNESQLKALLAGSAVPTGASNSLPSANDNVPEDNEVPEPEAETATTTPAVAEPEATGDTQLVEETPAVPEQEADPSEPAPELEAANDNEPPADLPATGTE